MTDNAVVATTTKKKRQRKPLPPASSDAPFAAREQLPALTGIPAATWATWASRPPECECGAPPMLKIGQRALYPLPKLFQWVEKHAAHGGTEAA